MDATLARTPLHGEHVRLGAKLVPFAGYEMPVQYPAGITVEHRSVREAVGLFDVCHMGEFVLSGSGALALIQKATVNDASALAVGQAQYSAMCRPNGGIVDDLLVYRFADHWMLVVNASNRAKDWDWLVRHSRGLDARLEDRSDDIALLALQGPRARRILAPLADVDVEAIGYYRFVEGRVAGRNALIAGTGYTGEDGFELYVDARHAVAIWEALLEAGAGQGLAPAGLGARDSLRLEMGYALYGNDLDEEHTPLEAGLGWITKLDKGDFVGRDALFAQKQRGVERKLVGLKLLERGFPRPGYEVLEDGRPVGLVTSGTVSPTLGVGIAMAWVPSRLAAVGTHVDVSLRGKPAPAEVVRLPFHTGGSIRK
ncbi:MAG: glycine cleavage system aminomethyltransferase GcvT [Gemmatimonadetes bacterium]|nr:glycine cleavage system aminomethyltransferase GcvT [Gemmatimonadota bacterium]